MNRFEKWSVWITSALTVLTGVGYFVTKYLVTTSDPYAVVNHPWQPFFLKAHILVSPLLLFAVGSIAVQHVWKHFVCGVRWSRRSGITTALAVVPMVATGYLIQALTAAGWVRAMALSHIGFGFLYGVGLVAHSWMIRRGPPSNGRRGREDCPFGEACAVPEARSEAEGVASRAGQVADDPDPESVRGPAPRREPARSRTASDSDAT